MDSFSEKKECMVTMVVPVYNSEKYLCRCLDSIVNQSFSNLEIILVNDGSTDGSGDICENYAYNDSRIQVIHSENQGQSTARNIGILAAHGEFVFFMDSDDEIRLDSIQQLYRGYCLSGADCVIGDFQRIDCHGNVIRHSWKAKDAKFDKPEISEIIIDFLKKKHLNKILVDAWGKLFKINVIKDQMLYFDETMKSHENMMFVFSYLKHCRTIYYVHQFIYTYYRNQDNIASGYLIKDPMIYKKAYNNILTIIDSKEKNAKALVGHAFIKESISTLFLIIQRKKISGFCQMYGAINLIVDDIDVRKNLKFYCSNNPDDIWIAPYLIKMRWAFGIIIVFKFKIYLLNFKMKLKSRFRRYLFKNN